MLRYRGPKNYVSLAETTKRIGLTVNPFSVLKSKLFNIFSKKFFDVYNPTNNLAVNSHFPKGTAQITLTGTGWSSIFPGDHAGIFERMRMASLLSEFSTPLSPFYVGYGAVAAHLVVSRSIPHKIFVH